MSLCRIALRIAAVEALKGQTLVGDNVLDTPNGALDVQADGTLRTDEEKPFISVYTDLGKAEAVTGRSLKENGVCDVVFEMGLSMAMVETDRETGQSNIVGIGIPASDRSFEFFLDIVQRQIADALTDPGNAWAEIYRDLHHRVVKTEYAGARNAEDGQRLAGHQLRITVDLADDPVGGQLTPGAPFTRFLERLETTDDAIYREQAAAIRALFAGAEVGSDLVRRLQGITAREAEALGLDRSDAASISEVTIEVPLGTMVMGNDQ